jgi:multidrug efflux pump subunit AcrB
MNTLNRVLAVVVLLALTAILVGALAAMFGYEFGFLGGYLQQERDYLADLAGWQLVVAVIIAVVLILVILALIVFEFFPSRREEHIMMLSNGENGMVSITRESVEQLAETVALQVPQVHSVRCSVHQTEEGFKIRCEPLLFNGTNIHTKVPELQRLIKEQVSEAMGVPVVDVVVRARYEAPEKQPAEQVLPS